MAIDLIILGVVIGFNNFATALALGAIGQEQRIWRILGVFALFEFFVPLIGLWLGRQASRYVEGTSDWLGPVLLAALGAMALLQSTRETRSGEELGAKVTSWHGLVFLSAGLSLDNLVVGFSLGLREVPALALATTIMVCSVIFAWSGIKIGSRSRRYHQSLAEALAGVFLIALAGAQWIGFL